MAGRLVGEREAEEVCCLVAARFELRRVSGLGDDVAGWPCWRKSDRGAVLMKERGVRGGAERLVPRVAVTLAVSLCGEVVEYRRRRGLQNAAVTRAIALVGRSAVDQINTDKTLHADPLMTPLLQVAIETPERPEAQHL